MFGIGAPSSGEFLVVMVIALLLFGRKLPEVAQSIGKGIRQFQSGLRGLENEVNQSSYSSSGRYRSSSTADSSASRPIPEEEENEDDFDVPKFVPPTAEPTEAGDESKTGD